MAYFNGLQNFLSPPNLASSPADTELDFLYPPARLELPRAETLASADPAAFFMVAEVPTSIPPAWNVHMPPPTAMLAPVPRTLFPLLGK